MSLFEHISATDNSERVANRRAAAVAAKRFDDQFGAFVKGASSTEEFNSRVALIENDLNDMVDAVVEDHGGNSREINSYVKDAILGPVGDAIGDAAGAVGGAASDAAGAVQTAMGPEGFNAVQNAAQSIPNPGGLADTLPIVGPVVQGLQGNGIPGIAQDALGTALDSELPGSGPAGSINSITPPPPPSGSPASSTAPGGFMQASSDASPLVEGSTKQALIGEIKDAVGDGVNAVGDVAGLPSQGLHSIPGVGGVAGTAFDATFGAPAWALDQGTSLATGHGGDGSGPQPSGGRNVPNPIPSIAPGTVPNRYSTKTARRPKMCPYHNELTDASLQAGEPQYAAFSGLVGGPSHCKGEFDGKCNFKPEMVTQSYWDGKQAEADERREQREMAQQESTPIESIPEDGAVTMDEGDTEFGSLDEDLADAPSAVGEQPFNETIEHEPMALAASTKEAGPDMRSVRHPAGDDDIRYDPQMEQPQPDSIVEKEVPLIDLLNLAKGDPVGLQKLRTDVNKYSEGGPATVPYYGEMARIIGDQGEMGVDEANSVFDAELMAASPNRTGRVRILAATDWDSGRATKFAALRQAKDCSCWKGYKRVKGTEPCAPGSCEKCDSSKESSRRQAEVAWDGGGATKNEKGNWAWGHQEPKADESGLDDAPSGPAMDKTRWQPAALDPNGKGNLKPVDSEYPGSPNPTIQEVLWERREDEDVYGQQEFGDGINSVTDKQELPSADETGLTTDKNLDQGSQGGTFGEGNDAKPVTSETGKDVLSSRKQAYGTAHG